jgi:nitrous oxidase accessory protein
MLTVEAVTKRYGSALALDGVSLEASAGEVVALLGANGAGKSTLLRCIDGLARFDGRILVDGIDVARHGKEARRLIGYLQQQQALYPDLTVAETTVFYAQLRGLGTEQARAAVDSAGLTDHAGKRAGALSGGMRQRLALAIALVADPPLLLLDEPFSGLDTTAQTELRELVRQQKRRGKTILLSTHRPEDLPYFADRALRLEQGRLTAEGSVDGISGHETFSTRLYLRLNGSSTEGVHVIAASGPDGSIERDGEWTIVACSDACKLRILEALNRNGIPLLDFRIEEADTRSATDLREVEQGA